MDTGYEPRSPGSVSAEESHSNTAGPEGAGEGPQTGNRGTKRQAKNRDAARKSRKKQTERADELHEELQNLEQSNSALQKEIASLKREFHRYTTALERHEPFCCLRVSAPSSSSTAQLPASPSAGCQSSSSPPGVPPQASSSTQAAATSLSTSLTYSLGLQSLDCVGSTHPSSSSPAPTTTQLASSTGSSSELFTSSSSTPPYPVSLPTAPHSLFTSDPPPLITSRPANVTPVCTGLVSNPAPSVSLTTAAQPQSRQGPTHEPSSMPANACFSPLPPGACPTKQASFQTASSNVLPPYSHSQENAGLVAQGCPMNVPQVQAGHFTGNPVNSNQPHSLLPSPRQDPALQSFSVSFQANPEPCPASAFASQQSPSSHVAPNPASLLSLLTVPSPLQVPQTTAHTFDGPVSQPQPLRSPVCDLSRELSLSELLDISDWIDWKDWDQ